MNNARPAGPLDEASLPDGDVEFIGVEERTVFAPPGYVNRAVNCRFRLKRAATRDGITILPWCLGTGLTPFQDVYGGFVFADPNGIDEYILVAANGRVYFTRPNTPAKVVPLPAGVPALTRATFKKFIQVNASILLLRGFSDDGTKLKPLQLTQNADGGPDFETGFRVIEQENQFAATLEAATNRILLPQHNLQIGDPFTLAATEPLPAALVAGKTYYVLEIPNGDEFTLSSTPGGTRVTWNAGDTDASTQAVTATLLDGAYPIPEAVDGLGAQNRTFLVSGKDAVAVSDVGDFTRYVPTAATFRINQGDAYTLKYLYLFNESTLLFFKNGNVSKAVGVTGDLSGAAGPLNVTQAYGMAAPSVADIGTDVYWLNSELRITSLQLTELNKEQGTNVALSDPLLRTFGRINPQSAVNARLAVFDGYLHVALPLDDAQVVSPLNLVPAALTYEFITSAPIPVTPGQTYTWQCGPNDSGLVNYTNVLSDGQSFLGDCVFTATGPWVVILVNPAVPFVSPLPVTAQLYAVVASGVNNAVAVYDFLNAAWCGTDESANGLITCVVDWLKFTYNGRQQLGFIGADGFLHLYADGYEDERVTAEAPYVDLFCDQRNLATYDAGEGTHDTLQINGGTLVAQELASPFNNLNGQPEWGTAVPSMGVNLWTDAHGTGGYNPAAANPWSAPDCTVTPIADGIRIEPTNGVLPEIRLNGVVVTGNVVVTAPALNFTYYFDWHSGPAIRPVDIVSRLLTRAYPCQQTTAVGSTIAPGGRLDFKRYTAVQLQLAGWDPEYTLNTFTQGQGDGQPYVEHSTRDYLKYFTPVTAPAWAPDNAADDFHAPNREDYAYPETGAGIFVGSGVNFDQLQEYTDTVPVSERGLYLQVEVLNESGRLELVGAALESQAGEQNSGVSVKN